MDLLENRNNLFVSIVNIVVEARKTAYRSNNSILLKMYWEIGKIIIEQEQGGNLKAAYGKAVLKNLSNQLGQELGNGFDERNLNNMRAFYSAFPIWNALRTELSWTHYRIISRIENQEHRLQYITYSIENNWDTRTLQRNVKSQYLDRLLELPREEKVPQQFIKDPYIFDFLNFPSDIKITENVLETALISHVQQFLMELGKGYAFVARQQHIVTDTSDYFIDLVFYNYYLKCFVLIDLKADKLSHSDIGQIDMYVRMYNDLKKSPDDNPTIGIVLCTEKDETIVKYSVLAENEHLFASKYRLYLPKEEELKRLIDQDRTNFELDHDS
nr:PDDEXK nuclease domain-containing protein [uncultured Flavobacterium sp.]